MSFCNKDRTAYDGKYVSNFYQNNDNQRFILRYLIIENAVLIRKAKSELYVEASSLRFEEDITDKYYIELLRNAFKEFRL